MKTKPQSETIHQLQQKAEKMRQQGKIPYALELVFAAIEKDPSNISLRYAYHEMIWDPDTDHVQRLFPLRKWGLMLKAMWLIQTHPEKALPLTEYLLKAASKSSIMQMLFFRAAQRTQLFEQHPSLLQLIATNQPENPLILKQLVEVHRKNKNYTDEYGCRKKLATLRPQSSAEEQALREAAAKASLFNLENS